MAWKWRVPRCCRHCDRIEAAIEKELQAINRKLDRILKHDAKEDKKMADIQAALAKLNATVERDTSVTSSAVTAIGGMNQVIQDLRQQIADLIAQGGDLNAIEAAVNAAADASEANTAALAAAIPANT